VKRAPAGSGLAPVASGTGAEASAGTGCVGMITEAATGSCSGASWASGWARGRRESLGRRLRHQAAAAEALRRRLLYFGGGGWSCERAGETERMNRCGREASIKILYF
jgi:hypothetical protein